ncbi:MAG TPA: hypothetical protein VF219_12380, partial [Vicinamibacterales bacterium]
TLPLWGGGKILGYQSILDVFPKDLQDVIPWASMLMSIVAVGVQFASAELLRRGRIRRAFMATFVALIVLVFTSYVVYKAFVVRIEVPGAGTKVAYLVGSTPLPSCECAKRGLEIRECIGREISVNPDEVSACFPREQISTRASILSGMYMLLMLALAMLIGLLVLQGLKPKSSRARPSK